MCHHAGCRDSVAPRCLCTGEDVNADLEDDDHGMYLQLRRDLRQDEEVLLYYGRRYPRDHYPQGTVEYLEHRYGRQEWIWDQVEFAIASAVSWILGWSQHLTS